MKDDNKEKMQQLSISLTETIKSSELTKVSGELVEVGIDSILKNGLLKDIPVISVLSGIWNTGVAIRDYRFSNKLLLSTQIFKPLPPRKNI